MISVITATFNSSATITPLIESLNEQSDTEFEWIIVDGASTDHTVELITEKCLFKPRIISQPDEGIYDAINKGIRAATSDYYVCIGSDDYFYKNAMETMNKDISSGNFDVYSYAVKFGGRIKRKSNMPIWLVLHRHFSPAHSVATVFSKALHREYGYYSLDYKIGSDLEFMLRIFSEPKTRLHYNDIAVGFFNPTGISSVALDLALDEIMTITRNLGFNPYVQRLANFYRRISHSLTHKNHQ